MRARFIGIGICIAVLLSLVPPVHGASFAFGHSWGGFAADEAYAISVDGAGNTYLAGDSIDSSGSGVAFLAKFDPVGSLVWDREFTPVDPAFGEFWVADASTTSTGETYLLGQRDTGSGVWSVAVLKVAADGSLAFAVDVSGINNPYRIAVNPGTGGVVIIGDYGYGQGYVVALSESGNLLWARSSAAEDMASPWGIATDTSGNAYIVMDRTHNLGIAKFSRQGHLGAQKFLNDTATGSYSWDLVRGSDGYMYALGTAFEHGGEALIAKFDTALNPVWTEYIGSSVASVQPTRILSLADGTIAAVSGQGAPSSDVVRTDADGHLLELSTIKPNPLSSFGFYGAAALPGGGYALAGASLGALDVNASAIPDPTLVVPAAAWDTDAVTWETATGVSVTDATFTTVDPTVPIDAFDRSMGDQAWFAAFDVPPSGVDVQVAYAVSETDPFSASFSATVANGTPPYTYRWSFGDGAFASVADPTHVYGGPGTYFAQLTAEDATGRVGHGFVVVALQRSPTVHSTVGFNHAWGTTDDEDVSAIVANAQGEVYVVGAIANATTGLPQGTYAAKFSAVGALQWNRVLQVPGAHLLYQWDACLDSAGNFVVSLDAINGTTEMDESLIAKLSPTGELLYAKTLDDVGSSYRIAADPSTGGVVVVGRDPRYGGGRVVALAADGSLRWATAISGGATADPWGVAVDSAGNSYVLMDRDGNTEAIAKFDPNGGLVSQRILLGQVQDYSYDLAIGEDGYLYALGDAYTQGDALLAKFDSALTPIWSEYLGSPTWSEAPFRVVPLPGGDVALWGWSWNGSVSQMVTFRVGPGGELRQETGFPMPSDALLWDASAAPGGGILAAGSLMGFVVGAGDAILDAGAWPVGAPWAADGMVWDLIPGSVARDRSAVMDSPSVPVDDFRTVEGQQGWYAGIDVPVSPPDVTISGTPQGSIWNYDFTSSVLNGTPPYTYRWSFGDGSFASTADVSHLFGGGSHFLVQLFVEDASGAIGVANQQLQIGSPPVITSLTASPEVPSVGQNVAFVANASDPDGGGIVRYDWTFGDGTGATTTVGSVNHTYAYAYTYQVTVTVTDDESDTASRSLDLLVTAPAYLWAFAQSAQAGLLPSTIIVDGVRMDDWRVQGVQLLSGPHHLSFSDVPDKGTPAPFDIYMGEGPTYLTGVFETYGYLRVTTAPALPATITVNGVALDDWGFWMSVPPGTYSVSFGAVDGYDPPPSQPVTVSAGANTWVEGIYTTNASAVGPDPSTYGRLRVTTAIDDGRAGVPSTISVDGVPRDQWALSFLKLPPGPHTVSFSDVPGLGTPAPMNVGIVAGETTSVVGTFQLEGWLRVVTNPPAGGLIYVDGLVRDAWGMWQAMPPGSHTVSFGPVIAGLCPGACVVPGPQTVTVTPGNLTTVIGDYSGASEVASAGTLPNGPARMTARPAHHAAPGARLGAPSAPAVHSSASAAGSVAVNLPTRVRPSNELRGPHPVQREPSTGDARAGPPLALPLAAVLGFGLAAPAYPREGGHRRASQPRERQRRARPRLRAPPWP